MTIEARIKQAEQNFETIKQQREQKLTEASQLLEEMNKLQGAYQVLQDMLNEPKKGKK